MVVALVVALNVVVIAVVLSRRRYRDRGSVVHYHSIQQAIGTAVDRSRHDAEGSVATVAHDDERPAVPATHRVPTPVVPHVPPDEAELLRSWNRGRRRAGPSGGPPRGRAWGRGLVLGLAGVAGVVLVLAALAESRPDRGPDPTTTTSAAAPTTPPPTAAPTTPPPPSVIEPVGVLDGVASYQVGPEVALVVTAQDRCWVGVTDPDGAIVSQQVLEVGDELPVEGPTPLVVRLGAPTAVAVRAGDVPVQVPGEPGQPLDLRFDP